MAKREQIITIYDFELKSDTLYQIVPKYDAGAPDGFRKVETTKALIEGIYNGVPVAVFNKYLNSWDAGLNIESPLLKKAVPDETTRKIVISKIQEYIVEPIEDVRGTGSLSTLESNSVFWDDFTVEIYTNKVFNTGDPIQLLQLYSLLLRREIAPKELQNDPNFKNAQYCIEDKESVLDKESEQAIRIAKAYGLFYGLKTTNKEGLIAVLRYVNLNVNEKTPDNSLDLTFKRFIEDKRDGFNNIVEFIKVAEDLGTKAGKNVIFLYQQLKELYAKGKVELRGKEVYIDDTYIASSFKTAAQTVAKDKKLHELVASKLE